MDGGVRGNFGNTLGSRIDAAGNKLDVISNALTAASVIPGLDTFTNLASIPVDLARGDYISAGLSALGAVPLVGEVADTAKIAKKVDKAVDAGKTFKKVSLPDKPSQIKHIFGNRPGHLPDTPANRKILTDTANKEKYYRGTDKFGNRWHIKTDNKGRQIWTRSQNGKINEGGRNDIPLKWDKETGLYKNPLNF